MSVLLIPTIASIRKWSICLIALAVLIGTAVALGLQASPSVSLDAKPTFSKVAVTPGQSSTLTIFIANDPGVPQGTKVTLGITEAAKDPGISYSVQPGRELTGTVNGDGNVVTATATFQVFDGSSAGTINTTVAITGAKDTSGRDVTIRTKTQTAITLTVTAQTAGGGGFARRSVAREARIRSAAKALVAIGTL